MKFGKRLAAEAERRYGDKYADYKALKQCIKDDIQAQDAQGTHFQNVLVAELQKVSQYYSSKATQLENTFKQCLERGTSQDLSELRSEVKELIKYVALNYQAVIKILKKRNRHLKENLGGAANTSLQALDLLMGEVFFTSPRLANLATQAEVLSRELSAYSTRSEQGQQAHQQLLEEYTCPVCLDTLHNPVVLTCAHRFCWGCLVAHCTASRETVLPLGKDKANGAQQPPATSYRVLEQLACSHEPESPTFYPCPVCRKPQILDIDTLQVDTYLEQFITNLQAISNVNVSAGKTNSLPGAAQPSSGTSTVLLPSATEQQPQHLVISQPGSASPVKPVAVPEPWGIIPPQASQHKGKLCVLLDLDGTLVSSFTPKRAPRLPAYVKTHVVGVGSKLNPQGVFVVERPGLTQFLEQLSSFAEVVVFTAGLEDYASPIIDAIDPSRKFFADRIYREGTLRTEYYQCVKDMARLNRDLRRTVLVDDTPLAFLHQPDNGVPILGFRGDPDDRLLLEAVLPLLQALTNEPDVKSVLHRRFDMGSWFKRHGFPVDHITKQALLDAAEERQRHMTAALQQQQQQQQQVAAVKGPVRTPTCLQPFVPSTAAPSRGMLLLADFDKTLTDFDAGERIVEQLAPELLPMLVGIDGVANFIPITNTLLSEIQRRGVSRDQLLTSLQQLGATELPPASVAMLQDTQAAGVDVKILSDCNSVFISHILAGARVINYVKDIITNTAAFEWAADMSAVSTTPEELRNSSGSGTRSGGHKLVIKPCQGAHGRAGHTCSMCPENLCKGVEVRNIRSSGVYQRVVYAGDGLNDICPALCLGPKDVVLARAGHPLAEYLQRAEAGQEGTLRLQASYKIWNTHEELRSHVQALMLPTSR